VDAGSMMISTSFQRGANATNGPYGLSAALSYSVYTHIAGTPAELVNKVVLDCEGPRGNGANHTARFRVGNVVTVGFSATVTGQKAFIAAPPTTFFTGIPYGDVTPYTSIGSGFWTFDYTLSPSKRQPDMNYSVIITPGQCYTLWMINGGGMIVADGFASFKRNANTDQAKMRREETLKLRAEAEAPEAVEVEEEKH